MHTCKCGGVVRQHPLKGNREAWTCNECGRYSVIDRSGVADEGEPADAGLELVQTNEDGDPIVIGALNMVSGVLMEFCLPLQKDYGEWSKRMEASGHALCTMTVQDMLDDVDYNKHPVH